MVPLILFFISDPPFFAGHERSLTQIKFNQEGDLLFSCSKDHIINVWFSHNGERLGTYDGHNGTVWTLDVDSACVRPRRLSPSYLSANPPNAQSKFSTIALSHLRLSGQRDAALGRADGQVSLRVGVPDGGQARRLCRRRRTSGMHHRAAHGLPGRHPHLQHQP